MYDIMTFHGFHTPWLRELQDDNFEEAERLAQASATLGKKDRNPRCRASAWHILILNIDNIHMISMIYIYIYDCLVFGRHGWTVVISWWLMNKEKLMPILAQGIEPK